MTDDQEMTVNVSLNGTVNDTVNETVNGTEDVPAFSEMMPVNDLEAIPMMSGIFTADDPSEIPLDLSGSPFNKFSPSIFTNDFTQYKKICFIDTAVVESFPEYLNSDTYPVIYSSSVDRESLKTFLLTNFTQIDRVAFVFHGPPSNCESAFFTPARFVQNETYFSPDNQDFLQEIFSALAVKNVDFLPCNLLQQQEWKDYFATFPNVVIGASIDETGNLLYGGDWVMESTLQDVQTIYFSTEIENYKGLLVSYIYPYTDPSGNSYSFTFTTSGTTATITGITQLTVVTTTFVPETVYINTTGYSVTTIGGLASVAGACILPYSCTAIESWAFANNSSQLTSISMPNVVTIGAIAFYSCNKLITLTNVNNTVVSIGQQAFRTCSVRNFPFNSNLKLIDEMAFYQGYSSLYDQHVIIPKGCVIGLAAFTTTSISGITFPDGTVTIPIGFCGDCARLTTANIPDSVKTIGLGAFDGCTNLQNYVLPEGLLALKTTSFNRAVGTAGTVVIPSTLISWGGLSGTNNVGNGTFSNSSVYDLQIRDGCKTIGDAAFSGCWKLYGIKIPNSVTYIGAMAFSGSPIARITLPKGLRSIEPFCFYSNVNTGNSLFYVDIPRSVYMIKEYAFGNCRLTSLVIPNSVVTIGESAFYQCTMPSVTIPNSVTSMGISAFSTNGALSRVVISMGLTSIGNSMFLSCGNLKSIAIPKNITSIGTSAFQSTGLTKIFFTGNAIPTIASNSFTGTVTPTVYYLASATNLTALSVITGATTVSVTSLQMYNLLITAGYINKYSADAILGFYSTFEFTQSNIQTAVNDWCADPTTATVTYGGPINTWNTVNVTNMSNLFAGKTTFDYDISLWNTSNVVNMDNMFENATMFNQDLSLWDVRKVASMTSMFSNATVFNKDLSQWEVPLIPVSPFAFSGMSNSKFYPNWGTYRLELNGKQYATAYRNTFYDDAGVSDLYSSVITTGAVINTSVLGSYSVTYSASAEVTGKSAPSYAIRYVNVVADPSTKITAITFPPSATALNHANNILSRVYVYPINPYWNVSVDGGYAWKQIYYDINTFAIPDGTYEPNKIQLRFQDGATAAYNHPYTYTNTSTIIIDVSGPTGLVVAFPSSNTTSTVSITKMPKTATSWEYSINGAQWISGSTSNSFTLLNGTYVAQSVRVRCIDVIGVYGTIVSNTNEINVPILTGFAVTLPSFSTPTNKKIVLITSFPYDAVSWKYSVDSGVSWTNQAGTSTSSFILSEGVYPIGAIKVNCTDAVGNTSTTISNTGQTTIAITSAPLLAAGFTAAQLNNAGYSPLELRASGYSDTLIGAGGYTAVQIKTLGSINVAQLKSLGYTTSQLTVAGYTTPSMTVIAEIAGVSDFGNSLYRDLASVSSRCCISGNLMYAIGCENKICVIDLNTNKIINPVFYAGIDNPSIYVNTYHTVLPTGPIIVEGNYLYFYNYVDYNNQSIGKIDLMGNLINSNWITGTTFKNTRGIASDGTYLYMGGTNNYYTTFGISRVSIATGGVATPFITLTYAALSSPIIVGSSLYILGPTCIQQYNLSTGMLVGNLANIVFSYAVNMTYYNSCFYIAQATAVNVPHGIIQVGLDGTIINPTYFVNPHVIPSSFYTNISDIVVYNDKLYCSTNDYGSIISISLIAPYVTTKPTATYSITFPATLGSMAITDGIVVVPGSPSPTPIAGVFTLNSALNNTVFNAGIYSDVSGVTFTPTDTVNYYNPIATTFQTITILQATPYISATPPYAIVSSAGTLGQLVISGGTCMSKMTGGFQLAGKFTVSTDLSNTYYPADTSYNNVTAMFTPSDPNYAVIATTINLVEVKSIAPLLPAGYTVDQMKFAGFTATLLTNAAYPLVQMGAAGFTIPELHSAGYSSEQIGSWGYTYDTTMRVISSVSNAALSCSIDGNDMYVADGKIIKVVDLRTNTVVNSNFYTSTSIIYSLLFYQDYLYFCSGASSIAKIHRSGSLTTLTSFITGVTNPVGITTDGNGYIYVSSSGPTGNIYRFGLSGGAGVSWLWISALNYPSKMCILGSYFYVATRGDGKIRKYNLSTGALVTANLTNSVIPYITNMVAYNSILYIGQNTQDNVSHGIVQVGIDGRVMNSSYFVNQQQLQSGYTNIVDIDIYDNKLYCVTNDNATTVISVNLPVTKMTEIYDMSGVSATLSCAIDGDFMYYGTQYIKKLDLRTNKVVNWNMYTATHNLSTMTVVGNYLLFREGNYNMGQIDLSTNVVKNLSFVNNIGDIAGITSDGTYLYVCSGGSAAIIYRLPVSTGGQANTPFISGLSYPKRVIISGPYLYVANSGGNNILKYNLADGTPVNSNLTNSVIPYMSNMVLYNSVLYVAQNTTANVPHGILQIGLDGTIINSSFFVNPKVFGQSRYTNIHDLGVYRGKLYCSTYEYSSVISIDLPDLPYISTRASAVASITYPAQIGSVVLTNATVYDISGGSTDVSGTTCISKDITNTVYNAGIYTDVSATFIPIDATTYSYVSTSIPSITVLKATPYLVTRPTSGTLLFNNTTSSITTVGGSCTVTVGGAVLAGKFSVHPDISNSILTVGVYQDVSAVFIPTSVNYNTIETTIQTLTVTAITVSQLQTLGISTTELKTAGYSATDLKTAGFTATQQKVAGYTTTDLKTAGFTATEQKTAGYTATEQKTAGFTATELKTALFTATELKTALFTATEQKSAGFTATEVKVAGYTATEHKNAGFTIAEQKVAGYTATEVKSAGYTIGEQKTAGFTSAQLKTALYTATEQKAAGFTAAEQRIGGFTSTEAKAALFTAAELKTALYTATEMKTALFTATEQKAVGYTATELKDALFTATEQKAAGFTATELKTALFTATELKTALYTATEQKAAGYTATQQKAAGFTATDLKTAQFTATELKAALYTATEQKAALFTATELKAALYSATELKTALYTAAEQKTGGYTATEMIPLYTVLQLKDAKYTPTELMGAGVLKAALYATFTTSAETKSVTKAVVSGLLSSTAKSVVPLSTLVGYSFAPAVKSAVTIKVTAANAPAIVDKAEIVGGATVVYAVLENISCYAVLPTWSSTIRVMSLGNETYRIYDSNGTTVLDDNLVAGDTRTYNGLTVVIGSITATLAPQPTVDIVLNGLNNVITLSKSGEIPNNYNPSLLTDATLTLSTAVPATMLQNTFFFRTDNPIATTDASFVYHYVDTSKWTNQSTTLSPKNGFVTSRGYVSNDPGGKDFLRDLARQLFGTYLAADLFTNETAVVADINTKFDGVATSIMSLLASIDITNGTPSKMFVDEFGKKYMKDDTSTSNISRELLAQLMTSAPARFANIKTNYLYNSVEDGYYKIPIIPGDTISFKVTLCPTSGQTAMVPTGKTVLTTRSYTVVLNIT